jgi:putative ABC transport system substrate-binding protein
MLRRDAIALIGAGIAMLTGALIAGAASVAQTPDKVYRLGVLSLNRASGESYATAPELAKNGFIIGRNLIIDRRFGALDRLPGLARELAALKPDAILAVSYPAVRAAEAETTTTPIIMFMTEDAVAEGLAASLARPGGNVTGMTIVGAELDAKRLQLLHEAVPAARRIAALAVSEQRHALNIAAMRQVATAAGLELRDFYAATAADYRPAFEAMRVAGAEALVVVASPELFRNWQMLHPLALEARLPTVCQWREMAEQGCLLGYGPDLDEARGRVADYVVRVLRGARPGELPIETPTRFAFGINLKTARAIGLDLPPSVLARATEVIE